MSSLQIIHTFSQPTWIQKREKGENKKGETEVEGLEGKGNNREELKVEKKFEQ